MSARLVRSLANLVSGLRIVLTPAFAWAVCVVTERHTGWLAAVLFAVIAASDFSDGRIARRTGTAGTAGQVLDHGADIAFLLTALAVYVALGAVPWWVPAAIAAAFATYVIDSLWYAERRVAPLGSRIGHFGGVCNYVLVGVLVGNETVGLHWLPPTLMQALFALVPLYSGAAIAARFVASPRAALAPERV